MTHIKPWFLSCDSTDFEWLIFPSLFINSQQGSLLGPAVYTESWIWSYTVQPENGNFRKKPIFFKGWLKKFLHYWCLFCVWASWADTVIPEDYLADAANRKQYGADPADAALGSTGSTYTVRQSPADGHPAGASSSSCGHRPAQVSSGGSSSTGLRHQTSSPTRNGAYLEGNRSGNVTFSI